MATNDLESLREINENIDAQLKEAEENLSKKPSIFRTQEKLIAECLEDSESESPGEHPPGIGTKATIRLQKAKIEALRNQVKLGVQTNQDLQGQVDDLTARLAEATKKKKCASTLSANRRTKSGDNSSPYSPCTDRAATTNACNETSKLRSELRSVKAELVSCQQSLEGERRNGQVKLQKAMQEVTKYKRLANTSNAKTHCNSSIDPRDGSSKRSSKGPKFDASSTKERDALLQKAKQLERQRHDLMVALKHQQRLIQTLQRQKVHTEAAKILAFKEETFVKEIGWGNSSELG